MSIALTCVTLTRSAPRLFSAHDVRDDQHRPCIYPSSLVMHVRFFFSSRSRHTKSKRDWSSDVCSSDLNDPAARESYTRTRGKGGFVRASWDEVTEIIATANVYTVRKYGPDRVFGFSPIPAMSMISYAAGTRYLSLIGGTCMSFYDWYCDLPPSSPQTWGEQTDVPESADWYNSNYLLIWGSNVPQTRTPDAHFYTEA